MDSKPKKIVYKKNADFYFYLFFVCREVCFRLKRVCESGNPVSHVSNVFFCPILNLFYHLD